MEHGKFSPILSEAQKVRFAKLLQEGEEVIAADAELGLTPEQKVQVAEKCKVLKELVSR